jgi:hypothetical protein
VQAVNQGDKSSDALPDMDPVLQDAFRTLKGAGLSVYIVLWICPEPLPAAWIGALAGRNRETIVSALAKMHDRGWVDYEDGWRLTDAGRSLPLLKFRQLAISVIIDEVARSEATQRVRSRNALAGKRLVVVLEEIGERDGMRCACCGSTDRLEVDHVVPVSKGGTSDSRNLQLLCHDCNQAKGTQSTDYRQAEVQP